MPERQEVIQQIAERIHKRLTPAEAGYSAPLSKFRWDQMTRATQKRFLDIATEIYDAVLVPMLTGRDA